MVGKNIIIPFFEKNHKVYVGFCPKPMKFPNIFTENSINSFILVGEFSRGKQKNNKRIVAFPVDTSCIELDEIKDVYINRHKNIVFMEAKQVIAESENPVLVSSVAKFLLKNSMGLFAWQPLRQV